MKKVVETRQVAHLWANRSQDQARNPGGNLSFVGASIQSYGNHYTIAAHLDDEARSILWNDYGYSSTTNKHRSHVVHALNYAQQQRRVYVPMMDDNDVRNLERLRGTLGTGKELPELATRCVREVEQAMETIGGASARATRVLSDAWHKAKRYESSGLFLCAYVAKGKRAPVWPIPRLPESLPATTEERGALARTMVKGKLIASYKSAMEAAKQAMDQVRGYLDLSDDAYEINNIMGRVNTAYSDVNRATVAYESAHGKKSSAVAKTRKELIALELLAKAKKDAFDTLHARHSITILSRDAFKIIHRRKHRKATLPTNRRDLDAGYIASKMSDMFKALPFGEIESVLPLKNRIERIAVFETAARNLERAHANMISAEAYGVQYPGDALRQYAEAFAAAKLAQNSDALYSWKSIQIDSLLLRSHGLAEEMKQAIKAKHAADVAAWKAGEKPSLPYAAGTYARIQGAEVVTSRGARVPILHACRLARIARRVIAAGGKTWADGEGPMVGGFRVASIGADGSAVIGCHEFNGEEGMRLLDVLESCKDCAHAHEEIAA